MLPLLLSLTTLALIPSAAAAQVSLSAGQTANVGNQKIIFLSAQDSRCPVNVQCIRAGELTATVLVSRAHKLRLLKLQWPPAPGAAWLGLGISGATTKVVSKKGADQRNSGAGPTALRVTFSDQQP